VAQFEPTSPSNEATDFCFTQAGSGLDGASDSFLDSGPSTMSSTLGSSLLSDLRRFAHEPGGAELLAVVAAGVRHARALVLYVQHAGAVISLSVLPREQLFHCAVDLCELPAEALARLRLLHVEPELDLIGSRGSPLQSAASRLRALRPLLWLLAMHGPRGELLPEVAGPAKYRLAPTWSESGLPIDPLLLPLLQRMRSDSLSQQELSDWTVAQRLPVRRLLNALYLQSGLIVSRAFSTHQREAKPRPS
jgi:hypothetical protein